MRNKSVLTIQNPHDFLDEMVATFASAKSGDILWLQSMLFDSGEHTERIVSSLCKAKRSNATVLFLLDSFGLLTVQDHPIENSYWKENFSNEVKAQLKKRNDLLQKLKDEGIEVVVQGATNSIKSQLPWFFCNHRKTYGIINESSGTYKAWITGVNLTHESFDFFDISTKIEDIDMVVSIYNYFLNDLMKVDIKENHIVSFGENSSYLITNNPNKSIIRDAVLSLIESAERYIRLTSQYPLDPLLVNSLIKKAAQGVQVQVLTSDINDNFNTSNIFGLLNIYFNYSFKKFDALNRAYFPGKVHAKILFSEKSVLTGSDNLSIITNMLQTKENMILISNNEVYVSQVNKIFMTAWKNANF